MQFARGTLLQRTSSRGASVLPRFNACRVRRGLGVHRPPTRRPCSYAADGRFGELLNLSVMMALYTLAVQGNGRRTV